MRRTLFSLVIVGSLFTASSAQTLTSVPRSAFVGPEQYRAGYPYMQGAYRAYDTSKNVAAQANGAAAAWAKSTIEGYPTIHSAEFLNDGYYGNGASWIAISAYSHVTIDLKAHHLVGSVRIGRDRLGLYNDRDPGQFWIYASETANSIPLVFSSSDLGYSGNIRWSETLEATFASPVLARYVTVQFEEPGTAIDEIEIHAVPEPATLAAFAVGLALAARRRRAR